MNILKFLLGFCFGAVFVFVLLRAGFLDFVNLSICEQVQVGGTLYEDTEENQNNNSVISTEQEVQKTNTKRETGVITLTLEGKGLKKVPEYVFEKTDTQILNLSNNELEGALQAEIRHLSQLQELDLSHNTFTGVPAEIGQLSNLKILNLSHNKLTGLPLELGNLQNLTVLDLRGNNYSTYDLEQIRTSLPKTTTILVD